MKTPLLALFAMLALPWFAFGQGGLPTNPYIYVVGKAEIKKPADMVTLSFTLSDREIDQAKANKAVQAQAAKVLALLESRKVAEKDIQANDLSSQAEYEGEDNAPHKGKFVGYRVSRPFRVVVRDLEVYPKLIDDLLALKIEEFTGIEEGLSNEEEIEDQIWDKAVANARERAEKTLKAAGMQIDGVFAISPIAFPEIAPAILGGNDTRAEYAMAATTAADKPNPSQYRLQPVSVSQSVHVIYLIVPKK